MTDSTICKVLAIRLLTSIQGTRQGNAKNFARIIMTDDSECGYPEEGLVPPTERGVAPTSPTNPDSGHFLQANKSYNFPCIANPCSRLLVQLMVWPQLGAVIMASESY